MYLPNDFVSGGVDSKRNRLFTTMYSVGTLRPGEYAFIFGLKGVQVCLLGIVETGFLQGYGR